MFDSIDGVTVKASRAVTVTKFSVPKPCETAARSDTENVTFSAGARVFSGRSRYARCIKFDAVPRIVDWELLKPQYILQ